MAHSIRSIALILVSAATLAACGGKPSDSAPAAAAAGGGAPTAAREGGTAGGSYHGIPIYPGMTELMTHDTPAAEGATLHAGSYRSMDQAQQIRAFYHEQLAKMPAGVVGDEMQGEGMIRMYGGATDMPVTILIHPGDSGEQIVGIQVISKN